MPRIVARQRPPLRLLLLLVALVAPTRAVAQEADAERCRPELTVRGDVRRLTLAPDGQVWLADTTGRTYRAAGFGVKGARILDLQGRTVPLAQAVAASLPGPEWSVSDISAAGDGCVVLVEMARGDRDTAPLRNLRWVTVPLAPR
jgi:hypothetical protein